MKYLRPSILLFLVAFLAYGLLIPQLGFYWDELPMTWIRYQLGSEALTPYFSTNRPVWGVLHQVTTRVLPQVPVYWQIFALLWRWLGAVVVYEIVAKLWKGKPQSALGVALLFLVYPGFDQHSAAYLYSHFYIVLFFFLCSLLCMLQAMDSPKRYWAWSICAILCAACLALTPLSALWLWPALVCGALTLVGLVDFLQVRQAIRPYYLVLAHFRLSDHVEIARDLSFVVLVRLTTAESTSCRRSSA